MSSIVGIAGAAGQVNYSASKAGIIGVTKSLAREVASRNINVNALAPGFIDTEMTRAVPDKARESMLEAIPARRAGQPEDIAGAIAFLVSPDADYITGQVLNISGGLLI
jgi:3-oxoacyl-[acyl-carrier protein] reductase